MWLITNPPSVGFLAGREILIRFDLKVRSVLGTYSTLGCSCLM